MVSLRCLFVIHVLNGVLHSYKLLSKMLIPFPFLASLGKSRPTGYCCILFCYIVLHESCLIRLQLVLNFFLSPLTCFFLFYLLKMSSSTPFPFVIGSLTDFSFVHSFNKYLLSHFTFYFYQLIASPIFSPIFFLFSLLYMCVRVCIYYFVFLFILGPPPL